jgi:hypothetical protein
MIKGKSKIINRHIFLIDWRFWTSLIGALLATLSAIVLSLNATYGGQVGPGTLPLCLAVAGFYCVWGLIKGYSGRRFTLIASLCAAFTVFIVLGMLSFYLRK